MEVITAPKQSGCCFIQFDSIQNATKGMHLIREGNIEQGEEGLQVEWGDAQADDKQSEVSFFVFLFLTRANIVSY